MFSRTWWKKALERMAKTAAQTILYLVPVKFTVMSDVQAFDWAFVAVSALIMAALSLCTSVTTTPAGPDPNDPSAV